MNKSVIGIVESRELAEQIVSELQAAGLPRSSISVVLPETKGSRDFAHEHHTKAPEGAAAGASAGGVVGGTLGLLAGIGALAIPGLGPFIAAGPLMAALSGAAAGAAAGGIAGALIGLGIPEIEAKRYEGKLRGGNVLIAAHVETSESQKAAADLLKENGAHDVTTTSESSVPEREEMRP